MIYFLDTLNNLTYNTCVWMRYCFAMRLDHRRLEDER